MNINEIAFPSTPFHLHKSLVLVGRRGSEAHGTYVPPEDPDSIDDRDIMGVCVPPEEMVLGTAGWTGTPRWEGADEIQGVWDVVLYDLRKFVRLLCKQNPNMLAMLWLEEEDYLYRSPEGAILVSAREMFRARDVAYECFVGYAKAQIHKMTSGQHEGYMGAKRKQLVEKFGFDCKNAAHCVRLLHMGTEFQRSGRLTVRRVWDRPMLIEIKRGLWSLPRIQEHVETRMMDMAAAREASVLPEAIDEARVEQLVVELMRTHLDRDRTERLRKVMYGLRDITEEAAFVLGQRIL